jgi:hypothetical protein
MEPSEEAPLAPFNTLPHELLSYVFSFLTANELFPSCFLINKASTRAVRDNVTWESRCRKDLMLSERFPGCVNWMLTYKEGRAVLLTYYPECLPQDLLRGIL